MLRQIADRRFLWIVAIGAFARGCASKPAVPAREADAETTIHLSAKVACSIGSSHSDARIVTMDELLSRSDEYEGALVRVSGFQVAALEATFLCRSEKLCVASSADKVWLECPSRMEMFQAYRCSEQAATVEGRVAATEHGNRGSYPLSLHVTMLRTR